MNLLDLIGNGQKCSDFRNVEKCIVWAIFGHFRSFLGQFFDWPIFRPNLDEFMSIPPMIFAKLTFKSIDIFKYFTNYWVKLKRKKY